MITTNYSEVFENEKDIIKLISDSFVLNSLKFRIIFLIKLELIKGKINAIGTIFVLNLWEEPTLMKPSIPYKRK